MYDVKRVHYRDRYGKLLWSEKMDTGRLYAVGQTFVVKSVEYEVLRVAVANDIQHVNVRKVERPQPGGKSMTGGALFGPGTYVKFPLCSTSWCVVSEDTSLTFCEREIPERDVKYQPHVKKSYVCEACVNGIEAKGRPSDWGKPETEV